MGFLMHRLVSRSFIVLLRYSFIIFFVCLYLFHYLQAFVDFLLRNCSNIFLIYSSIPSAVLFSHFSLSTWLIFRWQILLPCPSCISLFFEWVLFQSLQYVIYINKVINLLMWFCKFVVPCIFHEYVLEWCHCYNDQWVTLEDKSLDF